MRLQNYLNEKTFNVSADIDYIYKRAFKKPIDLFKKGKYHEFAKFVFGSKKIMGDYIFDNFTSSDLKSKTSQKADKMKPVRIYCGISSKGNMYDPIINNIVLSINYSAFNLLRDANFDINIVKEQLKPTGNFDQFLSEFSETKIKSSIYHEISHWLNDTLHNLNIMRRAEKAIEYKSLKPVLGKHKDVNLTDFEVDAQVHAIKQMKRQNRKRWDELTWYDLTTMNPSLREIFRKLFFITQKERKEYFKRLMKRLHRENLLGDKMKKSPDIERMF